MEQVLIFIIGMIVPMMYAFSLIRVRIEDRHARAQRAGARFQASIGEYVVNQTTGVAMKSRPRVSPDVQAEIDQTPEWWDKRFHELLGRTGAIKLEYGEVEYIEERTLAGSVALYTALPRPMAYIGCICQKCKATRMMGCDPRD